MNALPWGLLWYDSDPERTLEEKIQNAAMRYREKHGEKPNICFVPVKDVQEVKDIEIVGDPAVLTHHLWIGVAE